MTPPKTPGEDNAQMDGKNNKFANHVTQMAFNLSLSKNMIICLAVVAGHAKPHRREIYAAFNSFDSYLPSTHALRERGLVYAPDKKFPGVYKLTDAGVHVVELLKIAGLIQKIEIVNDEIFPNFKNKKA